MKQRLAGKRARINGATWETIFKRQAELQHWELIEMPLACKRIGPTRVIQIPSMFDCFILKSGRAAFLDLKSCGTKRFAKTMITEHQMDCLFKIEMSGFKAGYLINFRVQRLISFIEASVLKNLKERESLGPEDGEILGYLGDFDIGRIFYC